MFQSVARRGISLIFASAILLAGCSKSSTTADGAGVVPRSVASATSTPTLTSTEESPAATNRNKGGKSPSDSVAETAESDPHVPPPGTSEEDVLRYFNLASEPELPRNVKERSAKAAQDMAIYLVELLEYADHHGRADLLEGTRFAACGNCTEIKARIEANAAQPIRIVREHVDVSAGKAGARPDNAQVVEVTVMKSGGGMYSYDRASRVTSVQAPDNTQIIIVHLYYATEFGWMPGGIGATF